MRLEKFFSSYLCFTCRKMNFSIKDELAEVHLAKPKIENMSYIVFGLYSQTKHIHVHLRRKDPVRRAGATDFS